MTIGDHLLMMGARDAVLLDLGPVAMDQSVEHLMFPVKSMPVDVLPQRPAVHHIEELSTPTDTDTEPRFLLRTKPTRLFEFVSIRGAVCPGVFRLVVELRVDVTSTTPHDDTGFVERGNNCPLFHKDVFDGWEMPDDVDVFILDYAGHGFPRIL